MPKVPIARNILAANDTTAEAIQRRLVAHGIRTLNLMSSPGAGKTTLLERTIARLRGRMALGVIEGDIETTADAERIEAASAQTVRINTRGACHLEAHMIDAALDELSLAEIDLLVVENSGLRRHEGAAPGAGNQPASAHVRGELLDRRRTRRLVRVARRIHRPLVA